jgi:hypothetical protein
MATISRTGQTEYELRIFHKGTKEFDQLNQYAINFIGYRHKKFGYISNEDFEKSVGVTLKTNIHSRG